MIGYVRVSQSRSAIPRTFTSQHCAVPEEQITVWRGDNVAGMARVLAMRLLSVKRVIHLVSIFAIYGVDGYRLGKLLR